VAAKNPVEFKGDNHVLDEHTDIVISNPRPATATTQKLKGR